MRPKVPFTTLVLLVAMGAITAGCGSIGGAEAECVAVIERRVEAEPARAAPAEPFRLRGEGFADHSGPGNPLQDDCPRILPERGIRVEFVQGDKTWELSRLNAGEEERGVFEAKLEVPADAEPGEAVVKATGPASSSDSGQVPLGARTPLRVLGEDGGNDAVSGNWEGYLTIEPEPQSDVRGSPGVELDLKRSGSDDVSGTVTLPSGNDATPVALAVVSGVLRGDRLAFSARNAQTGERVDFEGTVGSGRMEGAAGLGSGDGRGGGAPSMGGTLKAEKGRDVVPGDW